jgi:hypothetical protein
LRTFLPEGFYRRETQGERALLNVSLSYNLRAKILMQLKR